MNIRRLWPVLALLLTVTVAAGLMIPSSLAYLTAQSNTILNSFEAAAFSPEDLQAVVHVQKTVSSTGKETISPEGFRFVLLCQETGETLELATNKAGSADAVISLADLQMNKTYTYRLFEINDGREQVIYSDKVYIIGICLSINDENRLAANITVDGKPVNQIVASFENVYSPAVMPPATGDYSQPLLYLVLMLVSGVGLLMMLTKRNSQVIK